MDCNLFTRLRREKDIVKSKFEIYNTTIRFVKDDITNATTEAIVNAANSSLMGGGGVDGAIHRKGGPTILEECRKIRMKQWPKGLPTGKAVITSGGNLRAKYVIQTVGPIWRGGNEGEPTLLRDAYINSLKIAIENNVKAIAFPSISTGTYGYPILKASHVALKSIKTFLENENSIREIVFVLFSNRDLNSYLEAAKEEFSQV